MNTERQRAEFEVWFKKEFPEFDFDTALIYYEDINQYQRPWVDRMWFAYQAGRAVLQSPEIQGLRRLAEALEEKIEMYERYGPICMFEGDPMIHAIHLEELRDAAMEQKT